MNQDAIEHFVLSTWVPDTPGLLGVIINDDDNMSTVMAFVSKSFQGFSGGKVPTFIDSGVSDTMFISRDDFNNYKLTPTCFGDSVKAVDRDFEIIGEGTVDKHYLVDGKEKKLIYTHAIHTPMLNANLMSVIAFNIAGLTVTFGGGCGVVRKNDGTAVLTAQLIKGMYVVDELDGDLPGLLSIPLTMISLSKPVFLAQ